MKRLSLKTSNFVNLIARVKSQVYRQQEPLHKQRINEINSLAEPLETAYRILPEIAQEDLEKWREEFAEIIAYLGENIDFKATADESLLFLQYMMIRATNPKVVLETGVWIGGSSYTILSALRANGGGVLHSIDFPPFRKKNHVDIGRLVPEKLFQNWNLYLGPSKHILESLLGKIAVDIFIHDSDHTYVNMTNEFNIAWKLVRAGGYIVSDDSSVNDSVIDFMQEKHCKCNFLKRRKGGTIAIMER